MSKNFIEYSIKDFNNLLDIEIKNTDTFQEFVDKIDDDGLSYFYVSMNEEDVLQAINNENEIAESLNLSLIYINELGIYIATY